MILPGSVNAMLCPRCGANNSCGFAQGQTACWCMQLPALNAEQTAASAAVCYCRNCLAELTTAGECQQSAEAQQDKAESSA